MSGKTKYKVGDEFPNGKRITKYMGSHPKWRVSMWEWECMNCGMSGGPSMTAQLTRTDRQAPRCCMKRGRDAGNWKGYKDISGVFLSQYRRDAQKKGREWAVTPQFLWSLWEEQNGRCALSGLSLTHGQTASLDRIDSAGGYTEDNVQWVHRDINRMKSDFADTYFIEMCQVVANFQGESPSPLGCSHV